jgi:hypothetical protein
LRIQCQNSTSSGPAGRPQYQACLGATRRHEQDARSKLEQDWSQYSAAQRNHCDGLVTDLGGAPSYVELLTCLEMAKQAKELPEDSKMENIGRH